MLPSKSKSEMGSSSSERSSNNEAALSVSSISSQSASQEERKQLPLPAMKFSFSICYEELSLEWGKPLGTGGFGIVYPGSYRTDPVAVKVLHAHQIPEKLLTSFYHEAGIMMNLRSTYTVQFRGVCMEQPPYCLVMERMKTSLYNVLHHEDDLSWGQRFTWAMEIAHGIAYLHASNVVHQDLKSANVLLDKHNQAKLTDFGLARVKNVSRSQSRIAQPKGGTTAWEAPELLDADIEQQATPASDMYSYGTVLFELASRKEPWEQALGKEGKIVAWVTSGKREKIPADCPPTLAHLISWCWKPNPADRPSAMEALQHLENNPLSHPELPDNLASRMHPLQNLSSAPSTSNSTEELMQELAQLKATQEAKRLQLEKEHQAEVAQRRQAEEKLARAEEELQRREKEQQLLLKQQAEKVEREKAEQARLAAKAEKKRQAKEQAMHEAKQRQLLFKQQTKAVSPQAVSALLKHVAEGEQGEAEALLKKTPALALSPSDVTDLSCRTFKGITAFQYAVWALDWHMWTMIRKYLPDDKAQEQVQGLKTGVWVKEHGSSVSWQNLLDALQKYIDLCGIPRFYQSQKDNPVTQWNNGVGGAQRLLPAHVVNEYCHPNRGFDPIPDFGTGSLPRVRKTDEGEWFTAKYNGGELGSSFAFFRGLCPPPAAVAPRDPLIFGYNSWYLRNGEPPSVLLQPDLQSCHALLDIRTQQRNQLITELLKRERQSEVDHNVNPVPEIQQLSISSSTSIIFPTSSFFGSISSNHPMRLFSASACESDALVNKLLLYVVHGEQDEAEKMLQQHATLLLKPGRVTDYSGRLIEGTALQMAIGSYDDRMVKMLLPYFDKVEAGDAEKSKQYEEFFQVADEKKAVWDKELAALEEMVTALQNATTADNCEIALEKFRKALITRGVIKGCHFNPELFIKACKLYDKHYDAFGGYNKPKTNLFAVKIIGYIQRFFPANIAQAFCYSGHNVVEKSTDLGRSLKFRYAGRVDFFPLISDAGLGFECYAGFALFPEFGAGATWSWARSEADFRLGVIHMKQQTEAVSSQTVSMLLKHVAEGEQDEAEKVLQQHPTFLLMSGRVTDYSGRLVEGTALQMALGSYDDRMVKMLLPYFDKIQTGDAEKSRQYEAFLQVADEKKAVWDKELAALEEMVTTLQNTSAADNCETALEKFRKALMTQGVIKGYHFNPELFIKACELYDKHYDAFGGYNKPKTNLFAVKVIGYTQRFFPANIAQAFCYGLDDVVEKSKDPGRSLKFRYDYYTSYFPLRDDAGLGFEYYSTAAADTGARVACGKNTRAEWDAGANSCAPDLGTIYFRTYVRQKSQQCKNLCDTQKVSLTIAG